MEAQKTAARSSSSLNGARSFRSFNAAEARGILSDRWKQACRRAVDPTVPPEDRPETYKSAHSGRSVWGKPSLHLQAQVDFLAEMKAALAKKH
ncbi:hypothetical protein ABBQ32_008042 [Trebouxia sp. C0010 RCD-2024]